MPPNIITEAEAFWVAAEPILKNRFIMYLDGIPAYMLKKVTIPEPTQEAKEIPHINLTRVVKGKTKWGQGSFTLQDYVTPSGAQAAIEWLRLHHESVTGRDGYADFYKKDVIINILDPVGAKVREFLLKGTQIVSINWGEFDWNIDDPNEITVNFAVDMVIINF